MGDEEMCELQRLFRNWDQNGDGVVSVEEFRQGLEKLGGSKALQGKEDIEDLMRHVDSDGSGCLEYTEFVAATMDQRLHAKRDVAMRAFQMLDLDGDGKITKEELRSVLDCSDVENTTRRIDRMVSEADANGDGCIDFHEFFIMMSTESDNPVVSLESGPLVEEKASHDLSEVSTSPSFERGLAGRE